jgi:hypothetical protein
MEKPRVGAENLLMKWGKVSKSNARLRLKNYPPFFPQVLIFKDLFVHG